MPPSFRPSLPTLYRIYGDIKREVKNNIKERNPRRVGTALIMTPAKDKYKILVAKDVSVVRQDVGKEYGTISLPMGFSKRSESKKDSVLRVLQQEVFTNNTIKKGFPYKVIPENLKPFMYLDIADVRVSVYNIVLPKRLSSTKVFSSFKLTDFQFLSTSQLKLVSNVSAKFRTSAIDILEGYEDYLISKTTNSSFKPIYKNSELNKSLATIAYNLT
jgi:hypothetical protein